MKLINPDVCSCCGEIWNRDNLKFIPLGKHELRLCPDCYAEYVKSSEVLNNGTLIPDNATNGVIFASIFDVKNTGDTRIDQHWWNAPYQKGGKE